jgi:geranylgeranyl diphosphate synthase type I
MAARVREKSPNPFVSLLSQIQIQLEPRLSEVLKRSEADARVFGEEVAVMVGAVRSLCERGGKRLRPALCVVGARAEDPKAPILAAIEAGVALELLQAYFLIHDDWMDQDEERRGGPTAHIALKRAFGSQVLGDSSAILAGDHAIAMATAHLAGIPTTPARLKKCFELFAQMQISAVSGQQLDVIGTTADPELTYRLKTASYTVRGPLLLGAELAGANKQTKDSLDAFSEPAGLAFQLRDDLIGVFSPPQITGKPQGSDLTEGKNTSLIHAARERLDRRGRTRLDAVLGNRKARSTQVNRVIQDLEDCGARSAVESRIQELNDEARRIAQLSALPKVSQTLLLGALDALANRKT